MTPDLKLLRKTKALGDILESMEVEFVDDPAWGEPSDTSYLSAKEKKDPDIASNVLAMAATNKLISWFANSMEGFVGFWHGPKKHPLATAPIVVLDTEGQYSIVATTIGDWVAVTADEDDFAATKKALEKAGLKVLASHKAIWKTLNRFEKDDPNDYRNELYNDEREKRGLARVE